MTHIFFDFFLFTIEDVFGMRRNALFALQAFSANNLNHGLAI